MAVVDIKRSTIKGQLEYVFDLVQLMENDHGITLLQVVSNQE